MARANERLNANLHRTIGTQEFSTIEELRERLTRLGGTGGALVPDIPASTPAEQAQDLMYDARDRKTKRERVNLARRALMIDPDCADAYVALAEDSSRTDEKRIEHYVRGVGGGERTLDARFLKEATGHLYSHALARPYIRARSGLAQALWRVGRKDEAIGHLLELLRLDADDRLGHRYLLAGWLLEVHRSDEAVTLLMERFKDIWDAPFAYARALTMFQISGNVAPARKMLEVGRQMNRFIRPSLIARTSMPEELPEEFEDGSEEEAIWCAAAQREAWRNTSGAVRWLESRG